MSTKLELIDQIAAVVVEDGSSITAGQRDYMMQQNIAWLEQKLADMKVVLRERDKKVENTLAQVRADIANDPKRIRRQEAYDREGAEVYRSYYLAQIFLTPVPGHGYPIQNQGSEAIILGFLNPGETLSRDFLVKVIQENPSLASQIQWRSVNPKHAEARQQELDKQTFVAAAKALRLGINEANFLLIRQTLGSGFSLYAIQQALASNALQLTERGGNRAHLNQR
jgi:hypothetical protein